MDRAKSALHPDNRRLLAEMIRYGLVSVIALVVDYATLYICWHLLGWHYLTAATLAFALGIVANYICSRIWVFDETKHHRWIELAIFLAVGVTGLGLNNLIMYLAHDHFGVHVMVSKLISTAIVFFWNFLLRRFLIYTGVEEGSEDQTAKGGGAPVGDSSTEPATKYGASSRESATDGQDDDTDSASAVPRGTDFKNPQEGTND